MISFNIDFNEGDLKEIIKRAKKLSTFKRNNPYFEDMRQEVARYLRGRWARNFNLQGTIYGGKWAPLSLYTQRTVNMNRNKKLVDTGNMKDEFLNIIDSPSFRGNGLQWSFDKSTKNLILIHQFGRTSRMPMPPRILYGINDKDRAEIGEIVQKHLRKFVSVTMSGK
jgi:phage gpG-like protein